MEPAFHVTGAERRGQWLITCDHATNHVPEWIGGGSIGLSDSDMARHIAYDPGALGVALALGAALDAPVIASNFSRLVIDPNRGEDDPTLIMQLYDGSIIAGNRRLSTEDRRDRLERLYRPYHAAYGALLASRPEATIVAMHSFTPCLRGRVPRPWHVGVLHSHRDSAFSRVLIARLRQEADLVVGDNEPYDGHLPGDAIDRHALASGRRNTLIEIRNDLIVDAQSQSAWGARLAPILIDAQKEMRHG